MSEFKLKGLHSLKLQDLDKVEAEVEGVENAKVLLVSVEGKVSAVSPNCTHFGAPLKTGVITSEGRLTCPWHGACFNVHSGEIEDAPAPDRLATFEVTEKNGGVYIKGDESDLKNGRKSTNVKCSSTGGDKVVVVGGGSGTFGAVTALREHNFTGSITVIHKEPYLAIDRTKLSKALIPDPSKLALRPQEWYDTASITQVQDEVDSIDFASKSVSTKAGKSYPYTKLILATGGTPRRLPLPGFKDLSNIFVLRYATDVQDILSAVGNKGKNIVIVGSSFIGMEVANGLTKDNTVSVVGMEQAPLERVMGVEVGKIFQKNLEKNGIKFYMGASVDSATPSESDSKVVGAVKLKDGTELPADLVILGVGVAPATEYIKISKAAPQLEKDGSLATDEDFAVKGLKDVYAIGDIATYPYHGPGGNGSPTRIEHWNVAQNQGRSVGMEIAESKVKPKAFIPVFWSALGAQLRYCGNTVNGWDSLVLKGEPENAKFTAFYCKGETVVALASMGMDPIMAKIANLMRVGKVPSKSQIESVDQVLSIKL